MDWKDAQTMKTMTWDDLRNTLIVALNSKLDMAISDLQGLSTEQLVQKGITWYNTEITVTSLVDCQFDLTQVAILSQSPVALVSQTYNNTSQVTLQNTFTISSSLEETQSFSQDESTNLQFGESLTVEAGIPEVDSASATINFQLSATQEVSYTNTSSVTKSFSESSPVSVPGGYCIKLTAAVTQGTYSVPYTCEANTQGGSQYLISGTYTFGDAYGLQVSQTSC